jgi:hypothetical protein
MFAIATMELFVEEVGSLDPDPRAFGAFYEDALPRIYGYFLHRSGGSVSVAEDLTQEAPGIYVIEPDGSDRMLLRTGLSGRHSSPSWSPGEGRIVFAIGQGTRSAIYLFDLASSRRTLLVAGASAPVWSPDGDTIAYRVDCGVKLVTPGDGT